MTQQLPPASPPALTDSKSSKSSSLPSSSDGGGDQAAVPESDLAHFEDIGLDDDHHTGLASEPSYGHGAYANAHLARKTSRQRLSGLPVQNLHAMGGTRDLVAGPGRILSPPLNSTLGQLQSAPLRPGPMSSRSSLGHSTQHNHQQRPRPINALSSPSTPSLPNVAPTATTNAHPLPRRSSSRGSTRSPSPSHQMPGQMQGPVLSAVPSRATSPALSANGSPAFLGVQSRRGSAVRTRKTAKELEQEYAAMEDGDDGALPDDATLWNVPMSPSLYRRASTTVSVSSANTSANTSPERASPRSTPRPSRLRPDTARRDQGPRTAPPFRRRPPLPHGHTTMTSPPLAIQTPDRFAFGPESRVKSWDNVLSELSEDAKQLSAALDIHETQISQRRSLGPETKTPPAPAMGDRRKSTGTTTTSSASLRRSRTVELLPLRANHVMIDPLPISKEKEKVLSRTRPSWLPPKDRKEEKKHLKEYQRIMERSLEAEKKRVAAEAAERTFRTTHAETLQRIWDKHVFPSWTSALAEPRTRELWWRGIPGGARQEAWRRAIGNELGLASTTYTKALQRAHSLDSQRNAQIQRSFEAMQQDTATVFPALGLFQTDCVLHLPLLNLLKAYHMYVRLDREYTSGVHLPAALFLMVFDTQDAAFTALANFYNRALPLAFLSGDAVGMGRAYRLVADLVRTQIPRLADHLFSSAKENGSQGLGLEYADVLEPMLRTLFLNGCCDPCRGSNARDSTQSLTSDLDSTAAIPSTSIVQSKGLSLPLALRIWDIIIFDNDAAIIRAAAGLLAADEARLYGSRDEVLAVVGWDGDFKLGGGTPVSARAAGADSGRSGGSVAGVSNTINGADTASPVPHAHSNDGEHPAEDIFSTLDAQEWSETVEAVIGKLREIGRQRRKAKGAKAQGKGDMQAQAQALQQQQQQETQDASRGRESTTSVEDGKDNGESNSNEQLPRIKGSGGGGGSDRPAGLSISLPSTMSTKPGLPANVEALLSPR